MGYTTMHLTAVPNAPDVTIDFIMLRLWDSREVALNWENSQTVRSSESLDFDGIRLFFDDDPDDVEIKELKDATVIGFGLYSEKTDHPRIEAKTLEFYGDNEELNIFVGDVVFYKT